METTKFTNVKILKIQTPEQIAAIILKFEHYHFTTVQLVQQMQTEWRTVYTLISLLLEEQSDLGLHCLPRPVCRKPVGLVHHGKHKSAMNEPVQSIEKFY